VDSTEELSYFVDELGLSPEVARQRLDDQMRFARLAQRVSAALDPAASGGTYVDQRAGTVVATVLDETTGAEARQLGATTLVVEHSMDEMISVTELLDAYADANGSGPVQSWGISVRDNAIKIIVGGPPSGAAIGLIDLAETSGIPVLVETVDAPAALESTLRGGQLLRQADGDPWCTLGFNVRDPGAGGHPRVLTAGHCFGASAVVRTYDSSYLGRVVARRDGAEDYAVVNVANPGAHTIMAQVKHYGRFLNVTGALTPHVGMYICRTGSTSGTRCGEIEAVGISWGDNRGVFLANMCGSGGDSGGPHYLPDGNRARGYGTHIGGTSAQCPSGPDYSIGQPLKEILAQQGLRLR